MKNSESDFLIEELAAKSAEKCGVEFVHLELVGKPGGRTLRVYIDKEEGITHDDCVMMSREFEALLDRDDPLEGTYTLEVSSPGIERGLYKIGDFERFKGEVAKVKTHKPIDGQRNFLGVLEGTDEGIVKINDRTNGLVEIEFELIRKANLEFDAQRELRQGRR